MVVVKVAVAAVVTKITNTATIKTGKTCGHDQCKFCWWCAYAREVGLLL